MLLLLEESGNGWMVIFLILSGFEVLFDRNHCIFAVDLSLVIALFQVQQSLIALFY